MFELLPSLFQKTYSLGNVLPSKSSGATLSSLAQSRKILVPNHILGTFEPNTTVNVDSLPLDRLLASHYVGNNRYNLIKLNETLHYNYLREMITALGNSIDIDDGNNYENIYQKLKSKKWDDDDFSAVNNKFKDIFNYNDRNVRQDDKHSPTSFQNTFFKMVEDKFDPYYSIFVDDGDEDGEYEIHDGKHRAVIKKFLRDLDEENKNYDDESVPLVVRSILKQLKDSSDSIPSVKMKVPRDGNKNKPESQRLRLQRELDVHRTPIQSEPRLGNIGQGWWNRTPLPDDVMPERTYKPMLGNFFKNNKEDSTKTTFGRQP